MTNRPGESDCLPFQSRFPAGTLSDRQPPYGAIWRKSSNSRLRRLFKVAIAARCLLDRAVAADGFGERLFVDHVETGGDDGLHFLGH